MQIPKIPIIFEQILTYAAKAYNLKCQNPELELTLAIDKTWNSSPNSYRDKLFPNGKPSIDEMLITLYTECNRRLHE